MSKKQEGSSEIPSKFDLLMRMWQHQKESVELLARAEFLKYRGDLDGARKAYHKLISVSKGHLDTALLHNQHHENPVEIPPIVQPLLNAMTTQANIHESLGDVDQGEKLRDEALELSREYLAESSSADMERARAASLTTQGRFNQALVALTAARDLYQTEGNLIKLARTTVDTVDILQWLGDYARALSELRRAQEIIAPLVPEGPPSEQNILTSFAEGVKAIMSGTGDGRRAQDVAALYRISLEIDYYQGLISKSLGRFEEAERFFGKVLPEYQRRRVGPAIEYHLASALVGKGKYQEGFDYAARLEPAIIRGGFLRQKLAALLKLQGEALLGLDKPGEALSRVQRGIADLARYHDPDLLWRLQWLEGRALEAMDQSKEALGAYAQAAHTVNSLRKAPLGYRLDSTYLKDKLELFERGIQLANASGNADRCCELMEMIKARILTATLSVPRSSEAEGAHELENQVDELTQQIDALEYTGYRDGHSDDLQKNRDSLLAKRAALLERIRFSDPRWRTMSEPVPFDLSMSAKVLSDRGQAALSLFYQPERIVAVLIKDGNSAVGAVEVSPDTNAGLGAYQRNLQAARPDPALYDFSAKLGIEANHLVPPDLLSQATQAKGLIIAPHGPLHLVPWGGLVFEGSRLFEYCPVGVLPNLSCLVHLGAAFSTEPRVALLGSPDYGELRALEKLPGSQREVETIREMYAKRKGVIEPPLVGEEATEDRFWKLAKHPDAEGGILHVACHGDTVPSEPMNSGLLLTGSRVDASEIARTSFKYDEVILSACSTGWRPMQVQDIMLAGDDIVGLPGAFLEAGARSVLVSIPRASDIVAPEFMILYHEHRVEGKTPLAALQEAQKSMLSNPVYPPHLWIGFAVYGCQ